MDTKQNSSLVPSFGDLDTYLNQHNSNLVWLLVGELLQKVPLFSTHVKHHIKYQKVLLLYRQLQLFCCAFCLASK